MKGGGSPEKWAGKVNKCKNQRVELNENGRLSARADEHNKKAESLQITRRKRRRRGREEQQQALTSAALMPLIRRGDGKFE